MQMFRFHYTNASSTLNNICKVIQWLHVQVVDFCYAAINNEIQKQKYMAMGTAPISMAWLQLWKHEEKNM